MDYTRRKIYIRPRRLRVFTVREHQLFPLGVMTTGNMACDPGIFAFALEHPTAGEEILHFSFNNKFANF